MLQVGAPRAAPAITSPGKPYDFEDRINWAVFPGLQGGAWLCREARV